MYDAALWQTQGIAIATRYSWVNELTEETSVRKLHASSHHVYPSLYIVLFKTNPIFIQP